MFVRAHIYTIAHTQQKHHAVTTTATASFIIILLIRYANGIYNVSEKNFEQVQDLSHHVSH